MAYLQDDTLTAISRELDRAKGKLAEIKETTQHAVREGMSIAEVGVGALGFSYLNARYSDDGVEYKLAGVPVDLAAAVALHALGWFGMAGTYEEDCHMLANGALASYLARLGTNLGTQGRQGGGGKAAAAGAFGAGYATAGLPAGNGAPAGASRYVVTEVPAYGG